MNQDYIDTVRLLLAIAPAVFQPPRFAMKGGTALNLFLQDMPRLSVDIDVVFTDHTLDRDAALQAIGADLKLFNRRSRQWAIAPCYPARKVAMTSNCWWKQPVYNSRSK